VWNHRATPKQVIIKLDPATPAADAQAVRSSLHVTVKTRFESIGAELGDRRPRHRGRRVSLIRAD
jgi:hypothetical protein